MRDLLKLLEGESAERGVPALTTRDSHIPMIPGKIAAILGMRRSGKTYFLYQQIRDLLAAGEPRSAILHVNFEDDRLLPLDHRKLASLLEAFWELHPENHDREVFLFLDEIQNVVDWPIVLRRFLDTRKVRICATGSSAKLLGAEIATSLRGRSLPCEMWPFSLFERLRYLGHDAPAPGAPSGPATRDRLSAMLRTHLMEGGFPETISMRSDDRRRTLQSYVDVAILRDIVERHAIGNVSLIRYLIKTLITSAGARFSVNKFHKDVRSQGIEAGKNTVHTYLAYVEDAFLAFLVPLHTDSVRKRNVNPRKVYVVDPGLVRAFSFPAHDLGPRFENLVYLDLRRRGCEIGYYITRSGFEVDFVARAPDGRTRLYQAAYEASDPAVRERELRALDEAREELGLEGMLVTTENYVSEFLFESYGRS